MRPHSSASTWRPESFFGAEADPHSVSAESGEGGCLPTDDGCHAETPVGEAASVEKPKWSPMSAKKVRELAKIMGKGKAKAKPKAKWKGEAVERKLKEDWNDTYSSDQPLSGEVVEEQYALWCEEGQPGKDMVEASFRPSKHYVGAMVGWTYKTGRLVLGTTEIEYSTSTLMRKCHL